MTAIYIRKGTKYLLLYRIGSQVVPPSWCGIGGHFEKDELNEPKKAALREMTEEIGLSEHNLSNMSLRYMTLRRKNGEIRQNYYYFADLRDDIEIDMNCDEGELKWVETSDLPYEEMPYTAKYIIRHYMKIGKNTDAIYAGIATDESVIFHELMEF